MVEATSANAQLLLQGNGLCSRYSMAWSIDDGWLTPTSMGKMTKD